MLQHPAPHTSAHQPLAFFAVAGEIMKARLPESAQMHMGADAESWGGQAREQVHKTTGMKVVHQDRDGTGAMPEDRCGQAVPAEVKAILSSKFGILPFVT